MTRTILLSSPLSFTIPQHLIFAYENSPIPFEFFSLSACPPPDEPHPLNVKERFISPTLIGDDLATGRVFHMMSQSLYNLVIPLACPPSIFVRPLTVSVLLFPTTPSIHDVSPFSCLVQPRPLQLSPFLRS